MKKISLVLTATLFILNSCKKDDDMDSSEKTFTVTIENVSMAYDIFGSGVFNTPVGESSPAPAGPGMSYEFTFNAAQGHKLSFATMYVQSNDLFYAPDGNGIDLFDGSGNAISGDITSSVYLWDAGTEVNEMPGTGPNQAPRQTGPNTGPAEDSAVRRISNVNDGYTYPSVSDVATYTLTHISGSQFKLTIAVDAASSTPLAPGVWSVHSSIDPFFTEDSKDDGNGLEALAEDGDPSDFGTYIDGMKGLASPIAPGVYAVHNSGATPLFENGVADKGEGLEALAEDGDPSTLSTTVGANTNVTASGVFNIPVGSSSAAPAGPGQSYQFSFTAKSGDYLSFATMFVQSNDLFYAPDDMGIALFSNNQPISGNITAQIDLWDAGTEANEYPGAGVNQAPRQSGPNTGTDESTTIKSIDLVSDGYDYPADNEIIKVTISSL